MNTPAEVTKAKILKAFDDVKHPGDDNLVPDPGHCPECSDIASTFKGMEWKSVSARLVREQKDALSLLTPQAFRYFFPAYLIACIDAREQIDTAWDSVIFDLTPPKQAVGKKRDFFERRAEGFTQTQIGAIQAFLELADERKREYWTGQAVPLSEDDFGPAIDYWKTRKALR